MEKLYTHIMRPVGVVKIEALDGILAIILWVSDSCNEWLLSLLRERYSCLLVVAPSIWMMQSDCLFISRLLKGRHLTATFTLDIWKLKLNSENSEIALIFAQSGIGY